MNQRRGPCPHCECDAMIEVVVVQVDELSTPVAGGRNVECTNPDCPNYAPPPRIL